MAEAVVTEGNDGLDGPVAASNGPSGRAVDIDGAVWQLAHALAGAVTPEESPSPSLSTERRPPAQPSPTWPSVIP